jgi:hypothetical protein
MIQIEITPNFLNTTIFHIQAIFPRYFLLLKLLISVILTMWRCFNGAIKFNMRENATMKVIPNPNSEILKNAQVGGAGIGFPPSLEMPEGMAAVLLYVPIQQIIGKSPGDIQNDLGLPWHFGGEPFWFEG